MVTENRTHIEQVEAILGGVRPNVLPPRENFLSVFFKKTGLFPRDNLTQAATRASIGITQAREQLGDTLDVVNPGVLAIVADAFTLEAWRHYYRQLLINERSAGMQRVGRAFHEPYDWKEGTWGREHAYQQRIDFAFRDTIGGAEAQIANNLQAATRTAQESGGRSWYGGYEIGTRRDDVVARQIRAYKETGQYLAAGLMNRDGQEASQHILGALEGMQQANSLGDTEILRNVTSVAGTVDFVTLASEIFQNRRNFTREGINIVLGVGRWGIESACELGSLTTDVLTSATRSIGRGVWRGSRNVLDLVGGSTRGVLHLGGGILDCIRPNPYYETRSQRNNRRLRAGATIPVALLIGAGVYWAGSNIVDITSKQFSVDASSSVASPTPEANSFNTRLNSVLDANLAPAYIDPVRKILARSDIKRYVSDTEETIELTNRLNILDTPLRIRIGKDKQGEVIGNSVSLFVDATGQLLPYSNSPYEITIGQRSLLNTLRKAFPDAPANNDDCWVYMAKGSGGPQALGQLGYYCQIDQDGSSIYYQATSDGHLFKQSRNN